MLVVEFYYCVDDDIIFKNEFGFNHANVAYRYPFVDPLKCFVLNQKKYDVYVRVLNTSKKKASNMIASQYFRREDVYAVAIDFTFERKSYLDIGNYCRLYLDCDVFGKHVVIFKIRMELLKNEKTKSVVL